MRRPQPVSLVALAIRQAVKQNPGIHFRGLARAAQVSSAGQLRHHLDRLEHQGVLVEVEDGRYKRFFVAGDQDPRLRAEMARFARSVPRRIAKLLLLNPMNRTELRRSLGCADSTLGYHLARMVVLGDLARVRGPTACLYSLANAETVRKILLVQGALHHPGAHPEPAVEATAPAHPGPPTNLAPSLPGPPATSPPGRPPPPSPTPPPLPQPDPTPRPPGPMPPLPDDQSRRPRKEPGPDPTPDPAPEPTPGPAPGPAPMPSPPTPPMRASEPEAVPDPIAPPSPDEATEWPGPDFDDDLAGPIP